jgi:hypothetical protein
LAAVEDALELVVELLSMKDRTDRQKQGKRENDEIQHERRTRKVAAILGVRSCFFSAICG